MTIKNQWFSAIQGIQYYTDITDFPEHTWGFIYIIQHKSTRRYYVGKKQLIMGTGKESNWKKYWGSSKDLTNYIKQEGKENFTREIIQICYTKKQLSYWEVNWQMKKDVLNDALSFNKNIGGRYFRKDLENY